jgi:hypothetical protein
MGAAWGGGWGYHAGWGGGGNNNIYAISSGGMRSGGEAAVPIWTRYMLPITAGQPNSDFPVPEGKDAVPLWTDIVLRLSKASYITIASIRGRTRGGGNELALAFDLRYASLDPQERLRIYDVKIKGGR